MVDTGERRIGKGTGYVLIGLALVIDIVQIVLNIFAIGIIANKIITVIAAGAFIFFLLVKDIPVVSNTKIFTRLFIALGAESVPLPLLDTFFFWTLAVWSIVRTVKSEDIERSQAKEAEYITHQNLIEQQKIRQSRLNNLPRNDKQQ